MKLMGYYLFHTILNTFKKLFKTWIAVILVIVMGSALFGGVVGAIAAGLSHSVVEEVVEDEQVQEIVEEAKDTVNESISDTLGVQINELIELGVSGIFLFIFVLSLSSSKGMGEIFLPADVNLLFSASIKPQSVMMFRLFTTMGMQLIMSVFMIFQIPNLVINLHLPVTAAIVIVGSWVVVTLVSFITQVLIYMLGSVSEVVKKNSKFVVMGLVVAIFGAFAYNLINMDRDILRAAIKTFTGTSTYWVPFWGWTRAMCMNAIHGNNVMVYLFLALNIVGLIAIAVVVLNLKVDYYEDAMISTERRAEKLEKAKTSSTGMVRNKDRSEKIKRDGFNKGSGANVFYYKTLYNRKRLSYFGFLTKTLIMYVLMVVAAIFIARSAGDKFNLGFVTCCCLFTGGAFFRSMGNPLSDDLSKDFFAMIPASAKSKLFYSLLGGIVNSLMDLIVPFTIAAVWFKPGIAEAIVWLLFIISVDVYGTLCGAFIMVSVSVNLSETVRQLVQIMFIYIGIVPALIFILIGLVTQHIAIFMPFGIVLNLLLAFIFFNVIPHFLQNGRK